MFLLQLTISSRLVCVEQGGGDAHVLVHLRRALVAALCVHSSLRRVRVDWESDTSWDGVSWEVVHGDAQVFTAHVATDAAADGWAV